jgi:hypothetical protein
MRWLKAPRVQFSPFWKITRWGFLPGAFRPQLTCDEYHNEGRYLIVPLVGCLDWFHRDRDLMQGMHLYASGPDGYAGRIVPGCVICAEILEAFNE